MLSFRYCFRSTRPFGSLNHNRSLHSLIYPFVYCCVTLCRSTVPNSYKVYQLTEALLPLVAGPPTCGKLRLESLVWAVNWLLLVVCKTLPVGVNAICLGVFPKFLHQYSVLTTVFGHFLQEIFLQNFQEKKKKRKKFRNGKYLCSITVKFVFRVLFDCVAVHCGWVTVARWRVCNHSGELS